VTSLQKRDYIKEREKDRRLETIQSGSIGGGTGKPQRKNFTEGTWRYFGALEIRLKNGRNWGRANILGFQGKRSADLDSALKKNGVRT